MLTVGLQGIIHDSGGWMCGSMDTTNDSDGSGGGSDDWQEKVWESVECVQER
jgi:hypothetical protein